MIELLTIDSTNNYALNLLKQPNLTQQKDAIKHGLSVFAHEQYAGKGQRGKIWRSKQGENIHLSIIIEPKTAIQAQFRLSAIVALAVRSFIEKITQSDIFIKWPNDIYFNNRKLGGILIENIITGKEWKWAVAGIGLNINQTNFEDELATKAVSVKQITGKKFDCVELAKALRNEVLKTYNDFADTNKNPVFYYNQFLYKRGEKVLLEKNDERFDATIKEVLPNGELVVQTDMELRFYFGEISWLVT